MIQLILICMGMCNVHRLMNDQYMELLPSLPKAQPSQSHGESPAHCLLVSLSELPPSGLNTLS